MARRAGRAVRKPVNLALQGGGAHGAFTWGVLDRLFEDGRIRIEAVSGTSAGAMNAVVAADGLMRAGEDGARDGLARFWKAVSDAARLSPIQRGPIDIFMGNWNLDHNPSFLFFDLVNRLSSPYDVNPLNFNPLQEILEDIVDFELVRGCDSMKVFVSATNVETGRVEVFDRHELTCDMVMASACLPLLFQAVEINGVPYWDGGYMGNPVLFPFYKECASADIVIVQINPVERPGTPRSAREILNRLNEITFNSSLLKELRAIDFVQRLLDDGKLDPSHYRRLHVHVIEAQDRLLPLGASSKLNAEWDFLRHLFEIGRAAAEDWIERSYDRLGRGSTVDIRALFQGRDV
jgi:NTE family protein